MTNKHLLEVIAQWIVYGWKDGIVFPAYFQYAPHELRDELVSYYISWVLKSGDPMKAFKAAEMYGIKISPNTIEDAKRYIIKNGKYGYKKSKSNRFRGVAYLTWSDVEKFRTCGINFSKREVLNILKEQVCALTADKCGFIDFPEFFGDVLGVITFFGGQENPIKIYRDICVASCEESIKRKDVEKFLGSLHKLMRIPELEKHYYTWGKDPWCDAPLPVGKNTQESKQQAIPDKTREEDMRNKECKMRNWLTSIIIFYNESNKEDIWSKNLKELIGLYEEHGKLPKETLDKIGHAFISNNHDIDPQEALACFIASGNTKMRKKLKIFTFSEPPKFFFERMVNRAIKEAERFSEEGFALLSFTMFKMAQELVKKKQGESPLLKRITEMKVKKALALFSETHNMYKIDMIHEDLKIINDKKIIEESLGIIIKKQMRDYYNRGPIGQIVAGIVTTFRGKFSAKEMESIAAALEKNDDVGYALEVYKQADPEFDKIKSEVEKRYPGDKNIWKRCDEQKKIFSKRSTKIKKILDKENKKWGNINVDLLADQIEKRNFYAYSPDLAKKVTEGDFLGVIPFVTRQKPTIVGTAIFKKIYAFVEKISIIEQHICRNIDFEIPMDEEKKYVFPIPTAEDITPEFKGKKYQEIIVKWGDTTPLQKKLLKHHLMVDIKKENWPVLYMCGNAVPEEERLSYFFTVVEEFLTKVMQITERNGSIVEKFKNKIDQEIIKVFLKHNIDRLYLSPFYWEYI